MFSILIKQHNFSEKSEFRFKELVFQSLTDDGMTIASIPTNQDIRLDESKLLSQIPSFIYIKNNEGTFIAANDFFKSKFQIDKKDLIGKTENEMNFKSADLKLIFESDQMVLDTGLDVENLVSINGEKLKRNNFWISVSKKAIKNDLNEIIGMIGTASVTNKEETTQNTENKDLFENRFSNLFANSQDFIFIADAWSGTIISKNKQAESFQKVENICQLLFRNFDNPLYEYRLFSNDILDKKSIQKAFYNAEIKYNVIAFELDKKDNSEIVFLIKNEKESIVKQEINEEKILSKFLDNIPIPIEIFDPKTLQRIKSNRAFSELNSISITEMDKELNEQIFQELLEDKVKVHFKTYPFYDKSGLEKQIESRLVSIKLDGKKYILSSLIDHTTNKKLEKALHESETIHEAIINNLQQAILVINVKTLRITLCNSFACDLFGFTENQLLKFNFKNISSQSKTSKKQPVSLSELIETKEFGTEIKWQFINSKNEQFESKFKILSSEILEKEDKILLCFQSNSKASLQSETVSDENKIIELLSEFHLKVIQSDNLNELFKTMIQFISQIIESKLVAVFYEDENKELQLFERFESQLTSSTIENSALETEQLNLLQTSHFTNTHVGNIATLPVNNQSVAYWKVGLENKFKFLILISDDKEFDENSSWRNLISSNIKLLQSKYEQLLGNQNYQETEQILTEVFNNVTEVAMAVLDKNSQYILFNQAHSELMQTYNGAMIFNNTKITHYILANKTVKQMTICIAETLKGEVSTFTETLKHPNTKEELEFTYLLRPIKNNQNEIEFISIYTYKENKEQQNESNSQKIEELTLENKELNQMVYKTTHDLRSPLASLKGLTEIIKAEDANMANNPYFNLFDGQIDKLDKTIQTIIDFRKEKVYDLKMENVDVSQLVEEKITSMKFANQEIQIQYESQLPKNFAIRTDKYRLELILGNLLSNSIKYFDPKKSKKFVKIVTLVDHKKLIIGIEDNGLGIDKDKQKKVFDLFYTATDQSKGTGLGLNMVKESIEKLGAKIELKSSLGIGSTFTVTIPIK